METTKIATNTFIANNESVLMKNSSSKIRNIESNTNTKSSASTTAKMTQTANKHISDVNAVLRNFQTIISSGNRSNIEQFLSQTLSELSALPSNLSDAQSPNPIVPLIGNMYVLLGQVKSGQVKTSDYQFFINNIQTSMQELSTSKDFGRNFEQNDLAMHTDKEPIQTLSKNLHNSFDVDELSDSATKGAGEVVQSNILQLNELTSSVESNGAERQANSSSRNLTSSHQQSALENLNMSNSGNSLVNDTNQPNHFTQVNRILSREYFEILDMKFLTSKYHISLW